MSLRSWIQISNLAVLVFAGAAFAQSAPTTAPDELVKKVTTDVLTTIQTEKMQDGDLGKIIKLVDEKIVPYTDFDRMTALAVGRAWRDATPAQREQLTAGFKQLLIRTYSGAVSQVRDVKLNFKPMRSAPEDTDVIVRTEALPSRGDPIELDYRLRKTDKGWKIYDVNVLGAWIIQTYRDSFAQEVSKNGIDGLIKAINAKNAETASKK